MIPIKKKKKGKKDYKCDFCGKSLTQAGSLNTVGLNVDLGSFFELAELMVGMS